MITFTCFSGRIRPAGGGGVRADILAPGGAIADYAYLPTDVHAVRWLSSDIRIDATRIDCQVLQ